MDKEILDKITDLKSYIRALIPSIAKKGTGTAAVSYIIGHLNELEELIKNKIL